MYDSIVKELIEGVCPYCKGYKFLRGGYECPKCKGTGTDGVVTSVPAGGVRHDTLSILLDTYWSMTYSWCKEAIEMFGDVPVTIYRWKGLTHNKTDPVVFAFSYLTRTQSTPFGSIFNNTIYYYQDGITCNVIGSPNVEDVVWCILVRT